MSRTTVACLAILLASACTTIPDRAAARSPDGASLVLGIGESARLADDSVLRYTALVNDSRCAPGVQCVWEGDAAIALEWRVAGDRAQALQLHTHSRGGPTSARIGARTVTLVALERGIAPKATVRLEKAP